MAKIVISFDVFDTLLTRAVGSPSSFLLLLGKELSRLSLITTTPEVFAYHRTDASIRAFHNNGKNDREITLQQIYDEFADALMIDKSRSSELIEKEWEFESKLIRPIPQAIELVKTARESGAKIVFISDMYMPAGFVKDQLIKHGIWMQGDICYVSSESGEKKSSGKLFLKMLKQESIQASNVIHYGNDLHGDVIAPSKIGIRSIHFKQGNLNRYEKILDGHSWNTEGFTGVMAAASRIARLSIPAVNDRQKIIRDIAASVASPILFGYAWWLLNRAEKLNLKRLYFISRDGQVLFEIAKKLVARFKITCEPRYLYGSRISWNLNVVKKARSSNLDWAWDNTDYLSIDSLLERFGIQPHEVKRPLSELGFPKKDWDRNLSIRERNRLHKDLLKNSEIQSAITEKAKVRRDRLIKYFTQEGLVSTDKSGMVDVGWSGSMYFALSTLVSEAGGLPPKGFYFGMHKYGKIDNRFELPECYFFNEHLNLGILDVPGNKLFGIPFGYVQPYDGLGLICEMFCSGDHGTVLGFKESGNEVVPILAQTKNKVLIEWGLTIFRNTVYSFVDNLFITNSLKNTSIDLRPAIEDVIKAFWLKPSPQEAKIWGAFPFEDGIGRGARFNPITVKYKLYDVLKYLLSGKLRLPIRIHWFEGSITQTPSFIRNLLKFSLVARNNMKNVKKYLIKHAKKTHVSD